jgi:hypothetical protein
LTKFLITGKEKFIKLGEGSIKFILLINSFPKSCIFFIIEACGNHPVFVISLWPRYNRCPYCSDVDHVTNFGDPDFISILLADLIKLRYHVRKSVHPVRVIDGIELICGHSYMKEKVVQTINAGWSSDSVHPSKHIYAKMALNLLEKIAPTERAVAESSAASDGHQLNQKRTWSVTNWSDQGASGAATGRAAAASLAVAGDLRREVPHGRTSETAAASATAADTTSITSITRSTEEGTVTTTTLIIAVTREQGREEAR